MTPAEAADAFFSFYRGKYRVLLYFAPADSHGAYRTFTRYRYRDEGDYQEPAYPPLEKGVVAYSRECRRHDLISYTLIDPGVARVPEKNDPRVSLETETGLRQHFGIRDTDFVAVLIGKDSREYGRYPFPVLLDDVLAHVATLDDTPR